MAVGRVPSEEGRAEHRGRGEEVVVADVGLPRLERPLRGLPRPELPAERQRPVGVLQELRYILTDKLNFG